MRNLLLLIITLTFASISHAAEFQVRSTGFTEQSRIPTDYTCDGRNVSPELSWVNPPARTQAFALVFFCPDCVSGTNYLWVIFNIPKETHELIEAANDDLPDEVIAANNSFGDSIYRGPCAPDNQAHHYTYTVYALDAKINLSSESELNEILPKIKHHAIGKAEITGVFTH